MLYYCPQTTNTGIRDYTHVAVILKILFEKGFRQKLDLDIHVQRSKLIHDPRSRPKGAQSYKIPLKHSSLVMGGNYLRLNQI